MTESFKISKSILLLLFIFVTANAVYGLSYLGETTQDASLRSGPGTNYSRIGTLPAETLLFIYSLEGENGFYKVKVIDTDTDGYASKSLVRRGQVVESNSPADSPFEAVGRLSKSNPDIKIYNNTSLTLTLTLNNQKYIFNKQERKTITIPAGRYKYMASAPGVIPYHGDDILDSYTIYSWEFYVSSR